MIMRIEGAIVLRTESYFVIDAGGVGYKVFVSAQTARTTSGVTASLWTHMAVRENSQELFGFTTPEELAFFEMLIGVSGVGPRSALAITAVAPITVLKNAIAGGDVSHLTGVSGIGKRTAEKIVVELKDKLANLGFSDEDGNLQKESDAMEALIALGYSRNDAREALRQVSDEVADTNAKIKEALKFL